MRSVNPNWTFVAEEFADEFVTLHSSSRDLRLDDVPHLRLGRRQFDRRIESHFIRVELISALDKLERIERVVPQSASEAGDTAPLFWIGEVRRELIDEARALLKLKCFVPQVSVEQPHHRLINVADAKDENVSCLFLSSPKHRHEHVAVAPHRRLNYRRTAFADLFPKIIKRRPITRFEPIRKSQQARAHGPVVNCLRAFSSGGRGLGFLLLAE